VTNPAATDDLTYEQARDELVDVVRKLEAGGVSLEESLALWERGEALATRCQQWLDGARARLDAAIAAEEGAGAAPIPSGHSEPAETSEEHIRR
jgi:exodeoxyribonuclease VII small subunit